MSANEAAYRHAAVLSESIKQTAICNAEADYLALSDDVPRLVKAAAGKNPSPAGTAAAETEVNSVTAKAMALRDAAIRAAEQTHSDRIAAAGRHYGVENGARGDPDTEAAQSWLKRITGQ